MDKAADLFTLLGLVFGSAILTLSLTWAIYNFFKPSFTRRWRRMQGSLLEMATHDRCLTHVSSKFVARRRRVSLPEDAIPQILWMLNRLAEAGDEQIKEKLGLDQSGLKLTWYLLLNRPGEFHELLEERIAQGETGPFF